MPWYEGPSLLYHLEHVHVASDRNLERRALPGPVGGPPDDRRAPRLPRLRRRGRLGRVPRRRRGGGAAVRARTTRIAGDRHASTGELEEAYPPLSVTLRLEDDIDVSRGDMICRAAQPARRGARDRRDGLLDGRAPAAAVGGRYRIKHTTRTALAKVGRGPLPDRREHAAPRRGGRRPRAERDRPPARCGSSSPLFVDEYRRNRATGSFILIDESTNDTVGAGMVL